MLGLSLSSLPGLDTESPNPSRSPDLAAGKTAKNPIVSPLGSSAEGRFAPGFAQRLEDALEAVREQVDPAVAGNLLPAVPLTAQPLGASSELITPADGEKTPEDVLYALALAQGLEPGVVQAVLWPQVGDSASVSLSDSGAPSLEADLELLESGVAAPLDSVSAVLPAGASLSLPAGLLMGSVQAGKPIGQAGLQPLGTTASPPLANTLPSQASPVGPQFSPLQDEQTDARFRTASVGTVEPVGFEQSDTPPVGSPSLERSAVAGTPRPEAAPGTGRSAAIHPGRDWAGTPILGDSSSSISPAAARDAAGGTPLARLISESMGGSTVGDSSRIRATAFRPDSVANVMTALPAAQWVLRQSRIDLSALAIGGGLEASALPGGPEQPVGEPEPPSAAGGFGSMVAQSSHGGGDVLDLGESGVDFEAATRTPSAREAVQEKMSEALAQRMVAQVNRGNWSLQLELKPADLGSISIDMNFHNGRLEAIFDASAAPARALLGDGLDRLRQELEKSGMNVAYLGMQNSSGGSSGGKPTPGRPDRKSDETASVAVASEGVVGVEEQRARSRGGSGLDLMV